MNFVWDSNKAAINVKKHGVPFEAAQTVFDKESSTYTERLGNA